MFCISVLNYNSQQDELVNGFVIIMKLYSYICLYIMYVTCRMIYLEQYTLEIIINTGFYLLEDIVIITT